MRKNDIKSLNIQIWRHPDAEAGFSSPHFYEHRCPICESLITIYEVAILFEGSNDPARHIQSRCMDCFFSAPASSAFLDEDNGNQWDCVGQANDNCIKLLKALKFSSSVKDVFQSYVLDDLRNKTESLNDKINHVQDNQHKVGEGRFQALSQQIRQMQAHFHEGLETCDKTIVNMVHEQTDKRIQSLMIEAKERGGLPFTDDSTKRLENKE